LAANLFLTGLVTAAVGPYRAVVAIHGLGFSTAGYATIMMINAPATATMSVVPGNLSDRLHDRRRLVMLSAVMGGLAHALIFAQRSQTAVAAAFCLILPLGWVLMSQSLAFSRAYYDRNAPDRAVFMTSVLRTMFSAASVVVPPVAGYIAASGSVLNVFALAALGHLGCALIFGVLFTRPEALLQPAPRQPSGVPFWRILPGAQLVGIAGILMLRTAIQLHLTVLPLAMLTDFHGTYGDVGLTAAVAAGLEVPFMILWGYVAARWRMDAVLIGNGALFAAHALAVSRAGAPLMGSVSATAQRHRHGGAGQPDDQRQAGHGQRPHRPVDLAAGCGQRQLDPSGRRYLRLGHQQIPLCRPVRRGVSGQPVRRRPAGPQPRPPAPAGWVIDPSPLGPLRNAPAFRIRSPRAVSSRPLRRCNRRSAQPA
jgi:MFS family permease